MVAIDFSCTGSSDAYSGPIVHTRYDNLDSTLPQVKSFTRQPASLPGAQGLWSCSVKDFGRNVKDVGRRIEGFGRRVDGFACRMEDFGRGDVIALLGHRRPAPRAVSMSLASNDSSHNIRLNHIVYLFHKSFV